MAPGLPGEETRVSEGGGVNWQTSPTSCQQLLGRAACVAALNVAWYVSFWGREAERRALRLRDLR